MEKQLEDFRVNFSCFDDLCLLSASEFGKLIGKSENAIYHMLCRHPDSLPPPVFRQNRYLRWRVGDVRLWLKELPTDKAKKDFDPE